MERGMEINSNTKTEPSLVVENMTTNEGMHVTLLSYYKVSRGDCYEASYEDDAMRMARTA